MSYREREDRRIIEFKLTEPEVAIGLIREAIRHRNFHSKLVQNVRESGYRLASILEKHGLVKRIHMSHEEHKKYSSSYLIGIDGSNQVVGGRAKVFYLMLTAVIVEFPQGIKSSNIIKKYPGIIVEVFRDPTGGEKAGNVAEDLMMCIETKAIESVIKESLGSSSKNVYVFIDGPLVDPPRESLPESLDVMKSKRYGVEDYIAYRAMVLKESIFRDNVKLYGYIKSTKSERLLKYQLIEYLGKVYKDHVEMFTGDEDLAYTVLLVLTHYTLSKKKYIYMFKPLPLKEIGDNILSGIYQKYREHGINIYYTFSLSPDLRRAYRLEIAFTGEVSGEELEKAFEEAVKVTYSVTLPGQLHPLPITIAHESCKIRPGAAKLIYQEIITSKELQDELDVLLSIYT